MPEETREEFLTWAKQRALEYVDRGELANAVGSMISDLGKNPSVYDIRTPGVQVAIQMGVLQIRFGSSVVKHWIEGFN